MQAFIAPTAWDHPLPTNPDSGQTALGEADEEDIMVIGFEQTSI